MKNRNQAKHYAAKHSAPKTHAPRVHAAKMHAPKTHARATKDAFAPSTAAPSHRALAYRRTLLLPLLAVLALVLMVLAVGFTASRYVTSQTTPQILAPENFYFESNYLLQTDVDIVTYNVYTDSVNIEIRNYDLVQAAESDITYSISVTTSDGDIATLIDVDSDSQQEVLATDIYTLAATTITNGQDTQESRAFAVDTYTLTASAGATVTVTATSINPYVKTITAIFQFQEAGNETVYEIVDMGYYYYLNIYAGEDVADADELEISYITSEVSPDNMDPMMEDWRIDTLYVYDSEGSVTYEGTTYDDDGTVLDQGTVVWSTEAQETRTYTIDIYQEDTGTADVDADDYVAPTELQMVPNGFYSLIFFENTLKDYLAGQYILPVLEDTTSDTEGNTTTIYYYTVDLTKLALQPTSSE